MSPTVLFRLYESGFNNDLMSLELAVGLAWITGRRLAIYGTASSEGRIQPSRGGRFQFVPESRRSIIDQRRRPNVFDLVGPLPIPVFQPEPYTAILEESTDWPIIDLHESAFCSNPLPSDCPTHDRFSAFAEGRSALHDPGTGLWHLAGRTLSYYSRFFFEPPPGLHRLLEQVEIAAPYRELAERIARSLGDFNAIHVRLTDFRQFQPRHEGRSRQELREFARSLFDPDDLLVIATDESENRNFFADLLAAYPRYRFLDEWIVREFGDDFRQLPYSDETAFGLVNRLVLHDSRQFAGTPGSSFTGMVHRARLRSALSVRGSARLVGDAATFRFVSSGFDDAHVPFDNGAYLETREGPYSWNRIELPVASATKSWYREWPEAVVPVI